MTSRRHSDASRGENVDLCVVMPVCNEEESIVAVFEELCAVLATVSKLKTVRLIVVDDYSQDNGIELLKQWYRKQQLRGFILTIIRLKHRHGMGNALIKGFKLAATCNPYLTLVMDADGQHDPACIPELVEQAKTVDMVCTPAGENRRITILSLLSYIFPQLYKIRNWTKYSYWQFLLNEAASA